MRRHVLIAAAVAGLALRGAYAWRQYAKVYEPIDSYELLARGLLERGELSVEPGHPTSMREPGYPVLIAGLYAASGGPHAWVVLAAHALMALAIAAMLLELGTALFSANVGAAAFAAYMLYPQSIYYCGALFRDTFVSFLFAAAAWAAARAAREKGRNADGFALLSGASAGVLSVTSTAVALGAVPAGAIALAMTGGGRLRRLALFLAPVLLLSGLWTSRNARVQGRFILGSTNGGGEMYQAMIIPAEDLGTPRQGEILRADAFWASVQGMPEAERNAALMRRTKELALADPALYAWRVLVRLFKLWRLWPYPRAYEHSYQTLVLISLASDAWMVPLGLFGFWLLRRRWLQAPGVPLAVAGLTGVYALLHAVIRYRLPAMSFVVLSAVACAAELWRRGLDRGSGKKRRRRAD